MSRLGGNSMATYVRSLLAASLAVVVAFCGVWTPANAKSRTETSVSVQFFYDDLAPYGRWVNHSVYGTVWAPASSDPGWHPYVDGRWVWTTDYGWYWDSNENFGWATYHYGRWAYTTQYGWVWVPDDVWGPAWVDWRYGDGNVGWTPMPPEYSWHGKAFVSASAHIDLASSDYASGWVFVTEGDFARGEIRAHRLPPTRNRALLGASARVTNYAAIDGRIVNRSVDPVSLSAATKVRIAPVRLAITPSLNARADVPAPGVIPLYRPRVVAKSHLDLDVPAYPVDTSIDIDQRVKALEGSNANVPTTAGGSVDTTIERSAPRVFDPPVSGVGIGGGVGLGGGLRIGR